MLNNVLECIGRTLKDCTCTSNLYLHREAGMVFCSITPATPTVATTTAASAVPECSDLTQLHKLVPGNALVQQRYGAAVAAGEGFIAVGAYNASGGAVDLFFPTEQGRFLEGQFSLNSRQDRSTNSSNSSSSDSQEFGYALAVSGRYLVVGAPGDREQGIGAGAAYVYNVSVPDKNASFVTKLVGSDTGAGDRLGHAVAVGGSLIVAGAPNDDGNGEDSGVAYVFVVTTTTTSVQTRELAKLSPLDGSRQANFGCAVAISGSLVAVGAMHDLGRGAVYIFRVNTLSLTADQKLKVIGSDSEPGDRFGSSLAMNSRLLIVGAMSASNDVGSRCGAAYAYGLSPYTTSVTPITKLFPQPYYNNSLFGSSVALDDEQTVVGAVQDRYRGVTSGAAYLFAINLEQLQANFVDQILANDRSTNASFGRSAAIKNGLVVLGADLSGPGAAYLFSCADQSATTTTSPFITIGTLSSSPVTATPVSIPGSSSTTTASVPTTSTTTTAMTTTRTATSAATTSASSSAGGSTVAASSSASSTLFPPLSTPVITSDSSASTSVATGSSSSSLNPSSSVVSTSSASAGGSSTTSGTATSATTTTTTTLQSAAQTPAASSHSGSRLAIVVGAVLGAGCCLLLVAVLGYRRLQIMRNNRRLSALVSPNPVAFGDQAMVENPVYGGGRGGKGGNGAGAGAANTSYTALEPGHQVYAGAPTPYYSSSYVQLNGDHQIYATSA